MQEGLARENERVRQTALRNADLRSTATKNIELFNLEFIFLSLNIDFWRHGQPFFNSLLRYVLLPAAAIFNIFSSILAWRQAALNKYEGYSVFKAIVETAAALVLTTAAIGTFACAAVFAFIGPAIYASVLAAKTLFSAGSAIYFSAKASQADNLQTRNEFREKASNAKTDAIVGGIVTAALVAVLLFAGPVVQTLATITGILACITGCVYLESRSKLIAAKPIVLPALAPAPVDAHAHTNTTSAKLAKTFGTTSISPTSQPATVTAAKVLPATTPAAEHKSTVTENSYPLPGLAK